MGVTKETIGKFEAQDGFIKELRGQLLAEQVKTANLEAEVRDLKVKISDTIKERMAIRYERDALLSLLWELEFRAPSNGEGLSLPKHSWRCPHCYATRLSGHRPDCALGNALKENG